MSILRTTDLLLGISLFILLALNCYLVFLGLVKILGGYSIFNYILSLGISISIILSFFITIKTIKLDGQFKYGSIFSLILLLPLILFFNYFGFYEVLSITTQKQKLTLELNKVCTNENFKISNLIENELGILSLKRERQFIQTKLDYEAERTNAVGKGPIWQSLYKEWIILGKKIKEKELKEERILNELASICDSLISPKLSEIHTTGELEDLIKIVNQEIKKIEYSENINLIALNITQLPTASEALKAILELLTGKSKSPEKESLMLSLFLAFLLIFPPLALTFIRWGLMPTMTQSTEIKMTRSPQLEIVFDNLSEESLNDIWSSKENSKKRQANE